MSVRSTKWTIVTVTAWGFLLAGIALFNSQPPTAIAESPEELPTKAQSPSNVEEARGRAKVLHETLHGVLQVVHRDFFREDEKLPIPSQSLEDVFEEVAHTQHIKLRWMAVNTEAMNVDHKPKSDFEKDAVKALASGEAAFESVTNAEYQYAGAIRLSANCLQCHLPSRSSNKDRAAALVITMPLKIEKP